LIGEKMSLDPAATATVIAAVVTVIATGAITAVTIRANSALNRRQQMAVMANTALGYFTGGTQNRVVGIAAMKMIQAGSEVAAKEDWLLFYRDTTITVLYGQLLYLYTRGSNRFQIHEITNIITMTDWLLSGQFILCLSREQKKSLFAAMRMYEEDAAREPRSDISMSGILAKLPEWTNRLTA
jgi:hypothetical protein